MGAPSSSSPGQAAPRATGRSVNFYLGAGLIAPVSCLLALWGLVTGLVLAGWLDKLRVLQTASPDNRAVAGAAVIAGVGLVAVVTVVVRLGWFARRLTREISGLTATASGLAGEQLPRIVAALRDGEQLTVDAATAQWPDIKITEIATAARATDDMYRAAVTAAAGEAGLRNGFRHILISLGRRNQSLLHRQLRIIDGLEQQASNPAALADLFTLDHLTTRMRRHAESLTILSGAASGRSWSGPVPVIDVMRAAAAEVEDYTRVTVISDSDEAVTAPAVTDMIHLLAELIENATLFSPSSTRVEVRAERVANGFAIEVEDRGLGIPPEQLAQINAQLASPPDFDLADADRLGLFVAGRLAARHGVHVALAQSPYRGTKAVVVLPDSIVVAQAELSTGARFGVSADADRSLGRRDRLNVGAPEVLSLAGAARQGPPAPNGPRGLSPEVAGTGRIRDTDGGFDAESAFGTGGDADTRAAEPTLTTLHGLPRRVRPQATPDPWDDAASAGRTAEPAPRPVPPEGPAPEEARSLAASLQNSWHRSRRTDQPPDPGPAPSALPKRRQDTVAPDTTRDNEEE